MPNDTATNQPNAAASSATDKPKTNGGDKTATNQPNAAASSAQPARELVHVGYLVESPIRFVTPKGVERSGEIGDVIAVKDLREDDRKRFEPNYISPKFESSR